MGDTSAPYVARCLVVDEERGNPYRAWRMMGRQRNPLPAKVELLREASRPECRFHPLTVGQSGPELEITLDRNAVVLVDMVPVEDEPIAYHGLDEAFYQDLRV